MFERREKQEEHTQCAVNVGRERAHDQIPEARLAAGFFTFGPGWTDDRDG
jgi:hypothetical protein